jgi:hypothetical protein
MLIFTISMILFEIYCLITGKQLADTQKDMLQFRIDKIDGKSFDTVEAGLKVLWFLVYLIVIVAVYVLYLTYAYPIDTLKYPTLVVTVHLLGCMFYGFLKTKLNNKTEEQERAELVLQLHNFKKHTILGKVQCLLWLGYFSYILYLILGGN